jgi:hypothetical protein
MTMSNCPNVKTVKRSYAAPSVTSYSAKEIEAALGPALANYGGPP